MHIFIMMALFYMIYKIGYYRGHKKGIEDMVTLNKKASLRSPL